VKRLSYIEDARCLKVKTYDSVQLGFSEFITSDVEDQEMLFPPAFPISHSVPGHCTNDSNRLRGFLQNLCFLCAIKAYGDVKI